MIVEDLVMSEFAIRRSSKGYNLLCSALQRAAKLYPNYPTFDVFCQGLAEATGETNAQACLKALARTVDALWARSDNRKLFDKYYGYQVIDKPSAKDFVYTLGGYVRRGHVSAVAPIKLRSIVTDVQPTVAAMPDGRPCLAIPLDGLAKLSANLLKESGAF